MGVIRPEDAELWADIGFRGWSPQQPQLAEFHKQFSTTCAAREGSSCFLAEFEGTPGAAGVLSLHEGVPLFAGASTIPELRRRGLQAARQPRFIQALKVVSRRRC